MPRTLQVSPDVALPIEWVTLATVVYGARGAGKTTFGRVIAEECYDARVPFCVIDPKGDWWGLKASADGKSEGIPVVVFGGDHGDVPLEPDAGQYLGRLVAELATKGVSTVLDLEHLSKGKQVRFVAAFLASLYHHNREVLLLIVDEVQRYAPQSGRGLDPDVSICLGAVEDVVKLGRKHGLGGLFLTQRGAGFNKEVSELGDVLVAFRTPGVLDQERINDWLQANTTAEEARVVKAGLAKLATGTAVIASGHPDLQLLATTAIRRPRTFDSSATPRIGQRRVEPKRLAQPDLEEIRSQMTAAIERSKAEDPKELQKRIRELEKIARAHADVAQTAAREQAAANALRDRIRELEAEVARAGAIHVEQAVQAAIKQRDDEWESRLGERVGDLIAEMRTVGLVVNLPTGRGGRGAEPSTPTPRPVPQPGKEERPSERSSRPERTAGRAEGVRPAQPPNDVDGRLGKGERTVLDILAQWPEGRTHNELAFLAGYSAKASTLGVILAKLRRLGYVEPGQPIKATPAGLEAAGGIQERPRGEALLQHWLTHPRIGEGERKVLLALIDFYPSAPSHEELCEATGYSPGASTMGVILSKLRKLGLVEKGRRRIADEFMEAIR
jgi:hypothetical protein